MFCLRENSSLRTVAEEHNACGPLCVYAHALRVCWRLSRLLLLKTLQIFREFEIKLIWSLIEKSGFLAQWFRGNISLSLSLSLHTLESLWLVPSKNRPSLLTFSQITGLALSFYPSREMERKNRSV